jgi:hypothetical protein
MGAARDCRKNGFTPEKALNEIEGLISRPPRVNEIEEAIKKVFNTQLNPIKRERVVKFPPVNLEQREAVVASSGGLVDLWETSPIQFNEAETCTELVIDALFPGNPLLCVGFSVSRFDTRSRNDWRGILSSRACIVPSPMSAITGTTQDGKKSKHTLDNTGKRRFLVVEQDSGSIDEQAAVLLHLKARAPLCLVLHSGRKSLHGWFYCHGKSEANLQRFMNYAVRLGADENLWKRSQFVRMPDGTRENGVRQKVYFFNPSWILATKTTPNTHPAE